MDLATISLRARSLTPKFTGSKVSLRKVPPARKTIRSPASTRPEQMLIKRQADLAIQRFNSGRRSLLAAKKDDWARAEVRLFRKTRPRWLLTGKCPDVRLELGKVRTEDVLGTEAVDFTPVRLKAILMDVSI